MIINLSKLEDFFNNSRIIYNTGDGIMNKYNNLDINLILEDFSDDFYIVTECESELKPASYYIAKDFYNFLINEINLLGNAISSYKDKKHEETLLLRCNSFKETFNFEKYYNEFLENLIISLNDISLEKLSEIIDLMKKEYYIFKKMELGPSIFDEMIDWIEDAFPILRKHAENLNLSQKVNYEGFENCYKNYDEAKLIVENCPYAA